MRADAPEYPLLRRSPPAASRLRALSAPGVVSGPSFRGAKAAGAQGREVQFEEFEILAQPDDETCGPTCLHAVYRAYGDRISLSRVIEEVEPLETGGTLAVLLAHHALQRGYTARIYTYNLAVFDPTWWDTGDVDLAAKLREQAKHKRSTKLRGASRAYLRYLELGGELLFQDLSRRLLREHLRRGTLLLVGLSATYLYRCARERGERELVYDDIRGESMGHFVVLYGFDRSNNHVFVADPYHTNPAFQRARYSVHIDRVIGAILLGVLTYDANLLLLKPKEKTG